MVPPKLASHNDFDNVSKELERFYKTRTLHHVSPPVATCVCTTLTINNLATGSTKPTVRDAATKLQHPGSHMSLTALTASADVQGEKEPLTETTSHTKEKKNKSLEKNELGQNLEQKPGMEQKSPPITITSVARLADKRHSKAIGPLKTKDNIHRTSGPSHPYTHGDSEAQQISSSTELPKAMATAFDMFMVHCKTTKTPGAPAVQKPFKPLYPDIDGYLTDNNDDLGKTSPPSSPSCKVLPATKIHEPWNVAQRVATPSKVVKGPMVGLSSSKWAKVAATSPKCPQQVSNTRNTALLSVGNSTSQSHDRANVTAISTLDSVRTEAITSALGGGYEAKLALDGISGARMKVTGHAMEAERLAWIERGRGIARLGNAATKPIIKWKYKRELPNRAHEEDTYHKYDCGGTNTAKKKASPHYDQIPVRYSRDFLLKFRYLMTPPACIDDIRAIQSQWLEKAAPVTKNTKEFTARLSVPAATSLRKRAAIDVISNAAEAGLAKETSAVTALTSTSSLTVLGADAPYTNGAGSGKIPKIAPSPSVQRCRNTSSGGVG
ncbi:hypothetical protein EDD11_003084 [Mortierella claussenii]|nr:hypothetical protein EDD11_003084 [Mortierella claussenii]